MMAEGAVFGMVLRDIAVMLLAVVARVRGSVGQEPPTNASHAHDDDNDRVVQGRADLRARFLGWTLADQSLCVTLSAVHGRGRREVDAVETGQVLSDGI